MRSRTQSPDQPVHVVPCEQEIRLGIGKPSGDTLRFTTLSLAQAEGLLRELGRVVARLKGRQRLGARSKAKDSPVTDSTLRSA
jgi:hypothetical protein